MKTTKKNSSRSYRMFLFKNDNDGRAALKALRKALNRGYYTMKVRGRGDRTHARGYNNDLPLEYAEKFAVYINTRNSIQRQLYEREHQRNLETARRELRQTEAEAIKDWHGELRSDVEIALSDANAPAGTSYTFDKDDITGGAD